MREWALASKSWEGPKALCTGGVQPIPEYGPDVQRIEAALVALGLEDAERLRAIKDVYLGHLNNTSAAIARRWTTRQFEVYLADALRRAFCFWMNL